MVTSSPANAEAGAGLQASHAAQAQRWNLLCVLAFRLQVQPPEEINMQSVKIAVASLAFALAVPGLAAAQGGAAAGAATGAVGGAIVGGPVGAVVGGAAGAAVGGAADSNANRTGPVIVEQPAPSTTQRTCVRDSAGNETCQQVTR
jgi:hypothetical protein